MNFIKEQKNLLLSLIIAMIVIPLFLFKGIDFDHSEINKVNRKILEKKKEIEKQKELKVLNKAYKPRLSFKEVCDKLLKIEENDCLRKCARKGIEDINYIEVYQSTTCSEETGTKYKRRVAKLIPSYKCKCNFADMVLN